MYYSCKYYTEFLYIES